MAKVLVIDDEMGNLNMFRLFLKAYGHAVLLAENGPAGLDLIEQEKPAIVFTDIKMPGMDGFEVLKQVKQAYPQTEVIVMTGHGDMDLAVQALNLDATDFITKPIQREALDAALTRAEERIRAATTPQENRVNVREEKNGLFILHLKGNVTAYSEDILLGSYRGIPPHNLKKLLLHFEETASINGAGVAVLIQLLTESKKYRQHVAITGISPNFTKIFEMVGITQFAPIFDDEQAALDHLRMTVP